MPARVLTGDRVRLGDYALTGIAQIMYIYHRDGFNPFFYPAAFLICGISAVSPLAAMTIPEVGV